jgi:hypothetical protein
MAETHTPPRPDPIEPVDRSLGVLVWVTIGTNVALGLLAFAGWLARPVSCPGKCSWRPAGGMLWVLLALIDVGLGLLWAGVGYLHLQAVGERIGKRIADKRDADRDDG